MKKQGAPARRQVPLAANGSGESGSYHGGDLLQVVFQVLGSPVAQDHGAAVSGGRGHLVFAVGAGSGGQIVHPAHLVLCHGSGAQGLLIHLAGGVLMDSLVVQQVPGQGLVQSGEEGAVPVEGHMH